MMDEKRVRKALYRIFEECGIYGEYAIVVPDNSSNPTQIATFPSSAHYPVPTEELWKIFKKFYQEELSKP